MRPTHIVLEPLFKFAAGNSMQKMGPRSDRWIEEVIQKLHEDHPYIAEYALQGKLVNSDSEKLYGVGYIIARNPTESKLKQPGARIPFIIENGMMHPLKVFLDPKGRADLLDKDVFGEAMFSSEISTSLGDKITPPSLTGQLSPPDQNRSGMLLGGTMGPLEGAKLSHALSMTAPYLGDEAEALLKSAGMELTDKERQQIHKTAMRAINHDPNQMSMLETIGHTITKADRQKVASTIIDEELAPHFEANGFLGLAYMAVSMERPKVASVKLAADVVQICREGNGRYRIKRANVDGFEPEEDTVSVRDVASLVGEDLVGDVNQNGRVTITTQPAAQENLEDRRIEDIEDYGIWKVQELESGKHVIGWVITNVVDLDMNAVPMKLFNSGDSYAFQEFLAGVRISMGQALPRKEPQPHDMGVFFYTDPSGRATCTIPMTIGTIAEDEKGTWISVVDTWGAPYRLMYAPGLKKIVDMGEGDYALPNTMQFMPLYNEIKIVPDATLFSKMANAQYHKEAIEIISDKGSFSVRGAPVEKLASSDRQFLTEENAEFLLVSLGVPKERALEKMAEAYVMGQASYSGVRQLVTKRERQEKIASIQRKIEAHCDLTGIKQNTVKIAAALPDYAPPHSVDTVLSLNFINPDNLQLFVENLPHLEAARRDLSELYMASCLGLPDVPKPAILRAAEALKETTEGLRKVKMRAMLV